MGDFKRSGGYGGGRRGNFRRGGNDRHDRFGGDRNRRGGRDEGRGEMFSAICAQCDKACEVSFRPTGEKPVYCNDCFRANRGASPHAYGRQDERGASFPKRNFDHSVPRFQSDSGQQIADLKKQLEAISIKLDKLMGVVGISSVVAITPKHIEKKKVDEADVKTVVADALGIPKKKTTAKKGSTKKKK